MLPHFRGSETDAVRRDVIGTCGTEERRDSVKNYGCKFRRPAAPPVRIMSDKNSGQDVTART